MRHPLRPCDWDKGLVNLEPTHFCPTSAKLTQEIHNHPYYVQDLQFCLPLPGVQYTLNIYPDTSHHLQVLFEIIEPHPCILFDIGFPSEGHTYFYVSSTRDRKLHFSSIV